jgi:uncharacterized protein YkwD
VACRTNLLSHNGFGNNCAQASFSPCAENVLYNSDASSQAGNVATAQWRDSAGHYANLISGDYSKIGLGYYRCDDGRVYWTALFGG